MLILMISGGNLYSELTISAGYNSFLSFPNSALSAFHRGVGDEVIEVESLGEFQVSFKMELPWDLDLRINYFHSQMKLYSPVETDEMDEYDLAGWIFDSYWNTYMRWYNDEKYDINIYSKFVPLHLGEVKLRYRIFWDSYLYFSTGICNDAGFEKIHISSLALGFELFYKRFSFSANYNNPIIWAGYEAEDSIYLDMDIGYRLHDWLQFCIRFRGEGYYRYRMNYFDLKFDAFKWLSVTFSIQLSEGNIEFQEEGKFFNYGGAIQIRL